jgi:hypothetical protein
MTVTLNITQSTDEDGSESIVIKQPGFAGLKGTEEKRHIPKGDDKEWRDHQDHIFGHVKGNFDPQLRPLICSHVDFNTTGFSQWRKLSELSDSDEDEKFLKEGWLDEPDYIESYVESQGNGWTARQIWGFVNVESEGKTLRKYGRRVVVKKGNNVIRARLFYNYIGPVAHK